MEYDNCYTPQVVLEPGTPEAREIIFYICRFLHSLLYDYNVGHLQVKSDKHATPLMTQSWVEHHVCPTIPENVLRLRGVL